MDEKLVRDKIPQIIDKDDKTPIYHICDDKEYKNRLSDKLIEEVDEYIESEDKEEIADILEVIDAILEFNNISEKEIEEIKQHKKEERGGFYKQIVIEDIE